MIDNAVEPFVAGKEYVLNEKYLEEFMFTMSIRNVLNLPMTGRESFTFTPSVVVDGAAYVDNYVIATSLERHMFDIVQVEVEHPTPEKNKTYAPFKEQAVYKLRKKYVDKFVFTRRVIATLGFTNRQFTFTALDVDSDGDAWGENNTLFACKDERHMFKRIDNK